MRKTIAVISATGAMLFGGAGLADAAVQHRVLHGARDRDCTFRVAHARLRDQQIEPARPKDAHGVVQC